jgi:histidine triad (HIT) family protein
MPGCLFCRIAARELPAAIVYEDDQCLAFQDIPPQAPVHLLIIPRKHIGSLNDLTPGDEPLLGHLMAVAAKLAGERQVDGSGYRTVTNTNSEAGQSVFHIHVHLLGGRRLKWPPG